MESYRKVVHNTKSDLLGDVLVALSELRRTSVIPDDAKITSVSANFSTPRTFEIVVQWKDYTADEEIYGISPQTSGT